MACSHGAVVSGYRRLLPARAHRGHARITGFVAAKGHAVPIGLSWQMIGDGAFGASGYRYCGNILVPSAIRGFRAKRRSPRPRMRSPAGWPRSSSSSASA